MLALVWLVVCCVLFFFKQKTAYEMRISDWSSDVCSSDLAPLAALHRKVDQCLARVGVAPETRAFLPHITLARLNRAAGPVAPFLALHGDLASAPFVFDHVILYESELAHGGSRYHPVARYPLDPKRATSADATASTSSHVAAKPSASP